MTAYSRVLCDSQVAKRKMNMLFVRGDGVILVGSPSTQAVHIFTGCAIGVASIPDMTKNCAHCTCNILNLECPSQYIFRQFRHVVHACNSQNSLSISHSIYDIVHTRLQINQDMITIQSKAKATTSYISDHSHFQPGLTEC